MRNWKRRAIFASAAAAVIAALQMGAIPASSQNDVYRAPRTADGKTESERHLAGSQHRKLGPADPCGATRTGRARLQPAPRRRTRRR